MKKLMVGLMATTALCAFGVTGCVYESAGGGPTPYAQGTTDFSVSLSNAQFAYDDGYYDNDRRWHNWRTDGERDWYRQHRSQTYYRMARNDDRDNYRRDWREGRRDDWRNGGGQTGIALTLGNVVIAYSDGYYDNDRRWHSWRNKNERVWYSQNHRDTYFQMTRKRDRDQSRRAWREGRRDDWRASGGGPNNVDFSIVLGNVVYGYSDGYYDNNRRWHRWRSDGERDWYRRNHRNSFYEMSHEDDRDHERRTWREGRR